jgi:hypothetical protein
VGDTGATASANNPAEDLASQGGWAVPGIGLDSQGDAGGGLGDQNESPGLAALAELVGALGINDLTAGLGLLLDRLTSLVADTAAVAPIGRIELLRLASRLVKSAGRGEVAAGRLAYLADRHRSLSGGVGAATWLTRHNLLTRSQASKIVLRARDLSGTPLLEQAAYKGDVNPHQAAAAVRTLKQLPGDVLSAGQLSQAEELLAGFADHLDSSGLAKAGRALLEQVAPELTQQRDEERAEREYRTAHSNRSLFWFDRGDGSTLLQATMPTIEAEGLKRLVDAYAQQYRRAQTDKTRTDKTQTDKTESGQGQADTAPASHTRAATNAALPPMAASRVDGLIALGREVSRRAAAPKLGGDRPRIQVVITYQELLDQARTAKLVGSGDLVPAGQLRTMLCDAGIIPAVLGSKSEILDVGRERRLVTGPIRAALELRDQGCSFPSCDRPVGATEAHHLKPWYDDGATGLGNMTLLCPHHHGLVEPPRDGPPQWEVRIRESDQLPEFIPPAGLDPERKPMLHGRFILQGAEPSPARPDDRPEPDGAHGGA